MHGGQARVVVGGGWVEALKAELVRQANGYTGVTGPTQLNAAGDRATGDYDFYQVCAGTPDYAWKRIAAFRAAHGETL
jgi:ABC-type branched-subunit amino acid transport system substrate-binding protein